MLKQIDRYSSGESLLLRLLALNKGPAHPSELRQRACTSSARVAATLGTLEKKGLLAREVDRQDRRRVLVTITDEGRERAEREIAEMSADLEAVFRVLGKADTEGFIRILDRLFDIFIHLKSESHGEGGSGGDKAAAAGKTAPIERSSVETPQEQGATR
jgi:DNA-binding MarR family transcriptional regulator